MSKRRYINQSEARNALRHIKNHTLSVIEAEEIITSCFNVIRDVVPILKERSEMGCICECPTPCRCGKDSAISLLNKLYSKGL